VPYSLDNDVGPQGTHVALLNGMHGTMGGVLELTAVLWLERTRDTILGLEMMRDTMLGLEMTIDAILGLEMTRDTILGLEMMWETVPEEHTLLLIKMQGALDYM